MMGWLTGHKKRIEEIRSVCEIAMLRLGIKATVHAARLCDSSVPGMRYLLMLDTPVPVRPGVILSLRGYLSSEIRASGIPVGLCDVVVVPIELTQCAAGPALPVQATRRGVGREDVKALSLRPIPPDEFSQPA